ncbi:MAG: glycosyltransferase [Candidatus Hatepunaea meridiana]|nr:glycosyltransferase [Candidatus Hatepunaea meridiana]
MRVLISAYSCEPGKGSEEEIGWSIVHEIAKRHIVWVITQASNRQLHEAAFRKEKKPDTLHFLYYDMPKWKQLLKRVTYKRLIYYYIWQIGSYFEARKFLSRQSVDFVHHLTKCMDWMPSGIALLGLPFLWGSVGSESTYHGIRRMFTFREWLSELFRSFVRTWGQYIDPFVRLTGKRAQIILTHTPDNLPRRHSQKAVLAVQTGIHNTLSFACPKVSYNKGEHFTAVFAGELVHWKGAAFAVDAFLEFASDKKDVRLMVLGDGPLHSTLRQKVELSGLSSQVEFKGYIAMNVFIEELAGCDVFLYPSYHHGLSTVVLQAMLTGLPIICIEGDAHGRMVGSECGITVSIDEGSSITQSLSSALECLYTDESLRISFARRAQEVAKCRYSYQVIGTQYEEVYQRFIG